MTHINTLEIPRIEPLLERIEYLIQPDKLSKIKDVLRNQGNDGSSHHLSCAIGELTANLTMIDDLGSFCFNRFVPTSRIQQRFEVFSDPLSVIESVANQ